MNVGNAALNRSIASNNFKSVLLLGFYPFLMMGMIGIIVAVINYFSGVQEGYGPMGFIQQYWPMVLAGAIIWFCISYFFHTTMIRKMAHSHPVTPQDEPELYAMLENLCRRAKMPVPKLEIIESHARNAFASGVNEKTFTVTVTRGLMQSLATDELEAVIAHELTHIQNRDVRLLIITVIFTGMVGFAAQLMWSQVRYRMWFGRRHHGNNGNGRNNSMIILFVILAVLWIGYFATLFTRFALSRKREYMADAGAAQMTGKPDAMMRALMRIAGKDQIPKIPGDIAMMCVENRVPFMGLFATHPPIEKRIQSLSEHSGRPIPDLPQLSPFHAPRAEREQTIAFVRPRNNWTTRQRLRNRRTDNPWY